MTDASFIDRMGAARVHDRGAARRRVYAAFQRAMQGKPADKGRWWTAKRCAEIGLVAYVTGLILVVWSVMAVRMMEAW